MRPDSTTTYAQCGTTAGLRLHRRTHEPACAACEQALAEFEERAALQRRRTIARSRALTRLKTIFHEVYDALIEEEFNKLEEAESARTVEATTP